jgi:hypothetical protein
LIKGVVAQGCPIEFLAVVLPQRHETIHVGKETLVVMAVEQMNHFMDYDVQKDEDVVLVLLGVHASTELVAAFPE